MYRIEVMSPFINYYGLINWFGLFHKEPKRSWPKGPSWPVSLVFFLLLLLPSSFLWAQDRIKPYQTQYTSISYGNDTDLNTFTKNIGSGLSFFGESPEKNPLLVKTRIDKIVEMASAILDMRPLNLRFNIVLYRTRGELNAEYKALGMVGPAPLSFYFHRTRTIAVSVKDITDRILAHEIAHAIICAYFGMPPPSRMQEILAQYVDKHLWDE